MELREFEQQHFAMRRSSTKERARKSSTASSDGTTQERARRLQSTVLHSSEVGATRFACGKVRSHAPLLHRLASAFATPASLRT